MVTFELWISQLMIRADNCYTTYLPICTVKSKSVTSEKNMTKCSTEYSDDDDAYITRPFALLWPFLERVSLFLRETIPRKTTAVNAYCNLILCNT